MAAVRGIDGNWTGTITPPDGNDLQLNFEFKTNGHRLSGLVQSEGKPTRIMEGKITGAGFTFKTIDANDVVIIHSGRYYADGDSISMNIEFQDIKLHSTLKRVKDNR
jgi:hypothetical protein